MTCRELDELLEPLAAGDASWTPETRAHLDTCPRCREAYALAVQIEAVLRVQPAPVVPETLTSQIMTRVRRRRWQSEQYLDLAFNVAVGLAVVIGVAGLYALLTATGVAAVSGDLVRLFVRGAQELATGALPQIRLYTVAMLVVVSGLAVWWWAERGLEF